MGLRDIVQAQLEAWTGSAFANVLALTDADGITAAQRALLAMNENLLFNGTTWDRYRGNENLTVLASAVRNATTNGADLTNYNAKGAIIFFDVTAVPGGDTVTVKFELKDTLSGNYINLFSGAAINAISKTTSIMYPAAVDTKSGYNLLQGTPIPRTWRLSVIHSGSGNFTYSLSLSYIK